MQVKCPCGKLLNVPNTLAGKHARCPACKNVFAVPGDAPAAAVPVAAVTTAPAPATPGKIVFTCSCGRRLSAPVGAAGKKILCPGCTKEIVVPSPAPSAAPAPFSASKPAAKPAVKPPAAPIKDESSSEISFGGDLTLDELSDTPIPRPEPDLPLPAERPAEQDSDTGNYAVAGVTCPTCKGKLEMGAQFCVACGTNLATGAKFQAATAPEKKEEARISKKLKIIIAAAIAGLLIIGGLTLWLVVFKK